MLLLISKRENQTKNEILETEKPDFPNWQN